MTCETVYDLLPVHLSNQVSLHFLCSHHIGLFLVQAIHVVEQGGGLQIHTDSNMAASTPPGVGRPSILNDGFMDRLVNRQSQSSVMSTYRRKP